MNTPLILWALFCVLIVGVGIGRPLLATRRLRRENAERRAWLEAMRRGFERAEAAQNRRERNL